MIIIGICGKKESGKDTCADYLVKTYGFYKISYGDSLKEALRCIFNFTDEQLYGNKKEIIDKYWNYAPREIMQFFGTELCRESFARRFPEIGDKVWIMSLQRNLQKVLESGITKIIVPDIRYQNECDFIKHNNGKIIKVIRDFNVLDNSQHNVMSQLCEHSSETNIISADYTIVNKTLNEFYFHIDNLMKYII